MKQLLIVLFTTLLISGCINQSWKDAKHTPQSDDTPKQAQPTPQTQSSSSANDDYKKCGDFYLGKNGMPKNDVEAYQHCKSSAEKGNPNAMYNLALFYQRGEGTTQNYNEAEKWFKAAADKGQTDAKYDLKQLDMAKNGGLGVPPKAAVEGGEAAAKAGTTTGAGAAGGAAIAGGAAVAGAGALDLTQYCLIAAQRGNPDSKCKSDLAKQQAAPPAAPVGALDNEIAQAKSGDPQAQNDLGVIYRRGLNGQKKNPAEAQKLFESAASKGSTNGMMNLASMYKEGDVQQNLELSYAWYNLAADRLPPNDPRKLKAQENVKEIAGYLNNQQIGNSLQYVTKLDDKIPVINESAAQAPAKQ